MYEENTLSHHGIKGQKWGVRRFQNSDGSLTQMGKNRNENTLPNSEYIRQITPSYKTLQDSMNRLYSGNISIDDLDDLEGKTLGDYAEYINITDANVNAFIDKYKNVPITMDEDMLEIGNKILNDYAEDGTIEIPTKGDMFKIMLNVGKTYIKNVADDIKSGLNKAKKVVVKTAKKTWGFIKKILPSKKKK